MSVLIPHTSMAVAIDVGHPTDVHPRDKLPVGQRLAADQMQLLEAFLMDNLGLSISVPKAGAGQ